MRRYYINSKSGLDLVDKAIINNRPNSNIIRKGKFERNNEYQNNFDENYKDNNNIYRNERENNYLNIINNKNFNYLKDNYKPNNNNNYYNHRFIYNSKNEDFINNLKQRTEYDKQNYRFLFNENKNVTDKHLSNTNNNFFNYHYQKSKLYNEQLNGNKELNERNKYQTFFHKNENQDNFNIFNNDKNKRITMNYESKKTNKKDEVSPISEDYLEETINTKTIAHHKSNKNKSKSINPSKNILPRNEIFHITNSLIGLNNLGSTCYMNSALQNIIHCKRFLEKLILYKNDNLSNNSISGSFLNLCYSLINKKYSMEQSYMSHTYSLSSFSPSSFKNIFCLKHIDFIRG